jgi:hypothetical protein
MAEQSLNSWVLVCFSQTPVIWYIKSVREGVYQLADTEKYGGDILVWYIVWFYVGVKTSLPS